MRTLVLTAAITCGSNGADLISSATAAQPAPPALPRMQPVPRADDFLPYGVYIAGGTWYDHEWAARNGGFRSVEAFLDNVTASMQAGGFNVVWPNAMAVEAPEYEKVLRAWIAVARPRGLRVIPQGGPFPGGTEEIYRSVSGWPARVAREMNLSRSRSLAPARRGVRARHGGLAGEPFGYDDDYARYWDNLPVVRWRLFTRPESRARYWMAVNFDLERNETPSQLPDFQGPAEGRCWRNFPGNRASKCRYSARRAVWRLS